MAKRVFSESNAMFQDGFIVRLQNRRIKCWKNDDDWYIIFTRYTKRDMSKNADDFDSCIRKMSGYVTTKLVKISEEAFINLTYMGFAYFNPHIQFHHKQPKNK